MKHLLPRESERIVIVKLVSMLWCRMFVSSSSSPAWQTFIADSPLCTLPLQVSDSDEEIGVGSGGFDAAIVSTA